MGFNKYHLACSTYIGPIAIKFNRHITKSLIHKSMHIMIRLNPTISSQVLSRQETEKLQNWGDFRQLKAFLTYAQNINFKRYKNL